MNILQQLRNWLKPSRIECSQLESPMQMELEDEYDAHQPGAKHKVPSFEQLFLPIHLITTPDLIKGFKFEIAVPFSQFFQTLHAWTIPNSGTVETIPNPMMPMATPQKPNYTFVAQLAHDLRGMEPYTIMVGKADNEGKVQSMFIRRLNKYWSFRMVGSFPNSNLNQGLLSTEVNYEDENSCSEIKLGQSYMECSYSQRLHRNFIFSFDYINLMTQKISGWNYGVKSFIKNHSLFGNYISLHNEYNLGYIIPIKKGTEFVANYNYKANERVPTTTLGFKQRYLQSEVSGTVNSKGEISTSISLRNQLYTIKLCAQIDYLKEKYAFGFGVSLLQG